MPPDTVAKFMKKHYLFVRHSKAHSSRVNSFNEARIGDASLEKGFLTKFAKLNVES